MGNLGGVQKATMAAKSKYVLFCLVHVHFSIQNFSAFDILPNLSI